MNKAMNASSFAQKIIPDVSFDKESLRYALQLAAAVLIAYLIPWLLHLPEGFWAVMTALIVMRSHTGATMEEGWARIKGALTGTAGGLLGVWLHAHGLLDVTVTLVVIAAMAFMAGLAPKLRAAPITALIILSSGGVAGHGPWQVAGLRIIEIAIGIAAGLLVSMLTSGTRTTDRFEVGIRELLKDVAAQSSRALSGESGSAEEKEEGAQAMRARLKKLLVMAASADTEHGMKFIKGDRADGKKHVLRAKLVARTVQDVGLFGRIYESHTDMQDNPLWTKVRQALPAALDVATLEKEGEGSDAVQALIDCLHREADAPKSSERLLRLLHAPVSLLAADIRLLRRLRPVSPALPVALVSPHP